VKNLGGNILLLLLATAFSLIAAELAVSIIKPQNLSGSWRIRTENGLFVNKSHGSSRHQHGNTVVSYDFASPHLRGPIHSGSVRVLVLGDSYTFGWLLSNEHNYVNLLQQKIDSEFGAGTITLLNAAAGGWGTGDYVAFVEDFGSTIKPDFILVFLHTDDIGRALKSPLWSFDDNKVLARTVPPKTPRSKLKKVLNTVPGYQWVLERSHLMQIARSTVLGMPLNNYANYSADGSPAPDVMAVGPYSNLDAETTRVATALGAALFGRLHLWCKEHDVYLAVATTGWHQPPYTESEPTRAFMVGANALFNDLGIPFSDTSSQLWDRRKNSGNTFYIPGDLHPNEDGAALIAEFAFPFLKSQLGNYCSQANRCIR